LKPPILSRVTPMFVAAPGSATMSDPSAATS
jgi:hypothetical protein